LSFLSLVGVVLRVQRRFRARFVSLGSGDFCLASGLVGSSSSRALYHLVLSRTFLRFLSDALVKLSIFFGSDVCSFFVFGRFFSVVCGSKQWPVLFSPVRRLAVF